jgi:hypothetical protein
MPIISLWLQGSRSKTTLIERLMVFTSTQHSTPVHDAKCVQLMSCCKCGFGISKGHSEIHIYNYVNKFHFKDIISFIRIQEYH